MSKETARKPTALLPLLVAVLFVAVTAVAVGQGRYERTYSVGADFTQAFGRSLDDWDWDRDATEFAFATGVEVGRVLAGCERAGKNDSECLPVLRNRLNELGGQ